MHVIVVLLALAAVSLIYATVGQAGGTGFLAVMAFAGMPAEQLRPTALSLNIVAAGYATWRLQVERAIEWPLLLRAVVPSIPAAFLGGLVTLESRIYYTLTGCLLLFAAAMMVVRLRPAQATHSPMLGMGVVGALAGFASGVTGIGGGVFLAPAVVGLGWVTARQSAALSAPFILANSIAGLAGALLAGLQPAPGTPLFAVAALAGAVVGTMIGLWFMSERATRAVLAVILAAAALRLLTR